MYTQHSNIDYKLNFGDFIDMIKFMIMLKK